MTRTAWIVISGAMRTCCVMRSHGKSLVKRELLTNRFGIVAIGDTSANMKRDCPSETSQESGVPPGTAGITPLHLPVDDAGIVTVSDCQRCDLTVS